MTAPDSKKSNDRKLPIESSEDLGKPGVSPVGDESEVVIPVALRIPQSSQLTKVIQFLGWFVIIAATFGVLFAGWWQFQNRTLIQLTFADGHGLAVGDPLRHRGITVGEVTRIGLTKSLAEVHVALLLYRGHESIAREGSRFWIERPTISAARIRGVETLLEGRHVAVEPGLVSGKSQVEFRGLDDVPIMSSSDAIHDGLEVILESEDRYHVQVGTPVTYRGLQVGQVTSIQLSSDAMKVEGRVQIAPDYMNLVRSGTEFWVKYPMDFHVGFGGVDLNLGTLETLAAGGIAFATPTSAGEKVLSGHRFALQSEEPGRWREWRPNLAVGRVLLADGGTTPRLIRLVRVTPTRRLGIRRERREAGWVIPIRGGLILGPAALLSGIPAVKRDAQQSDPALDPNAPSAPADIVDDSTTESPADETGGALPNTPWLEVAGKKIDPRASAVGNLQGVGSGDLALLDLGDLGEAIEPLTDFAKLRAPTATEDCLLISPVESAILPISVGRLKVEGNRWWLDRQLSIARDWEGALVVGRTDGKIIGQLMLDDGLAYVALLDPATLQKMTELAP
jgi:paraquat-inducible protein B